MSSRSQRVASGGYSRGMRPRVIDPKSFLPTAWRIAYDLLLNKADYPRLASRVTQSGPAVSAVLMNDGLL